MAELMAIAIGSILINNFILARFLGLCPFFGVSKKLETAFGMGFAVMFVMTLASIVTWFLEKYLLTIKIAGHDLTYLRTVAFILVIASLVQFVEMFLQKMAPALYESLGIFLPLITTNCAVLGVAILNIQNFGTKTYWSLIETTVQGFSAAVGFTLALVLMAGIRERLEYEEVPKYFQGTPLAFITAGLMALAFMGFNGLKLF
jgi:electron transport complex protein RnfA